MASSLPDDSLTVRPIILLTEVCKEYTQARINRDTVIALCVHAGVSRLTIAKMAGLSKPRIDQIARGE